MKNNGEMWVYVDEAEAGQGLVEYALILLLIAIALVTAMTLFKDKLYTFYANAGNSL